MCAARGRFVAYLMWVQGEIEHNAYTVEGVIRHRRVDKKSGKLPEEPVEHFLRGESTPW
jgi:hypothetical protein